MRWDVVAAPPRSIYVHVPFCRRRCFYCDFPVSVVGDKPIASRTAEYIDLLLDELSWLEKGKPLASCYIGGGTPSLVAPSEIARLLDAIDERLGLAGDAEVTLEADPGTFDSKKLDAYVDAGVTRLSLGVQSFCDAELEASGRAHTADDARDALEIASSRRLAHGFSIDLISGLPGQTLDSWRATLREAVDATPAHVSVYDLQIQGGTAFARWYGRDRGVLFADDDEDQVFVPRHDRPPLPTEDEAAQMYVEASTVLRDAGFDHYEISSFAATRRSAHNARYWVPGASWHALGVGATSAHARPRAKYPSAFRFSRPRTLRDYRAYVHNGPRHPPSRDDDDDDDDDDVLGAVADDVLTSLRTSQGLPLARVRAFAGADALAAVLRGSADARDQGLATIDAPPHPRARTYLRLADPHGFLVSNTVIAAVFHELSCL
ncbi:hypothetical protein CTAYLR_001234 [Chrysophaeum taylorii]|uniref:Radical S-adenosyl methionine domain-containing protein 1, mitochondrial n=1 Tax=Chrysophaeum taylorii TaxID=2483200 RepID=A0AAD7XLE5_9STRA|nr:hypothetical protein CTAYLR_001234 [Chrysophaeum taylorii]